MTTMKQTLSAWLHSVCLRTVTPKIEAAKSRLRGHVDTFFESICENTIYPLVPAPPRLEPSETTRYLFAILKPKFNSKTDLLLISEDQLDEATYFDDDEWLSEISDHMIVLSNDLKNVAIVRAGYSGGLF